MKVLAVVALAVLALSIYTELAPMDGDYSETETVAYTRVVPVDVEVPLGDGAHVPRSQTVFYSVRFVMSDDHAVRQVASAISASVGDGTDRELAEKARWWVSENIRYASDHESSGRSDYWQTPWETLRSGTGDCEDHALLFLSICCALGIPCVLVEEPGHASAAVLVETRATDHVVEYRGQEYVTADPTSNQRIGWSEPEVQFVLGVGEDAVLDKAVLTTSIFLLAVLIVCVRGMRGRGSLRITLGSSEPVPGAMDELCRSDRLFENITRSPGIRI